MAGGALRSCGLCRHLEVRRLMTCQQIVKYLCSVAKGQIIGNACTCNSRSHT